MDKQNDLQDLRHSLSHLLAAAVMQLYPDAKRAIGPAIDNGFYYDFEFSHPISDTDLPKIEAKMREILPTWKQFARHEVTKEEALSEYADNRYKIELINEFSASTTSPHSSLSGEAFRPQSRMAQPSPQGGEGVGGEFPLSSRGEGQGEEDKKIITVYQSGNFRDLCRGGHVDDLSTIDPHSFKLTHTAGAYWRGSEKNKMLTRIYGLAFANKEELEAHMTMLEEAKKRDHKLLGKQLKLFTFSAAVGSGLPLYLPSGTRLREAILDYITELKEKRGYQFVWTPHLAKESLYKQSGHLGKYDAMMPSIQIEDGERLVVKPMNCPHHFEIYNADAHSYRDLPVRIAENATDYRNEKSGELNGLLRVRSLTMDDTHHIVRHDQIASEIDMILALAQEVYQAFGFRNFRARISTRDLANKNKYFGTDALWQGAEESLLAAVKRWGVPYFEGVGEAAFYGPKIDVMIEDALGREWQLTTVQLDYVQPENFDMTYIDEKGEKSRPSVLHVAILGSLDRFLAITIEHFAGAFPVWLAPEQVVILPISEKHHDYATEVFDTLKKEHIRVRIDERNESLGKRIRETQVQKIPYILVVGDKEKLDNTVAIRHNKEGDKGTRSLHDFTTHIIAEIAELR